MGRRMSMLRGALVIVVILLVFVLAGCAGGEEEGKDAPVPSSLEEADNVMVRVSGAQDTAYIGHYGTLGGEPQIVEDTLEAEPQEYEVEIEGVRADGVSASFRKIESDTGELKAEIVADDVVVAESRTRVPPGSVIVEWIPEGMFQEEGVPEEEHTH
jgi:hypothetical protein